MRRVLPAETVRETLAELGFGPARYTIENNGRRLSLINAHGELRQISLELAMGESEGHVIARIGKACGAEAPEFLEG